MIKKRFIDDKIVIDKTKELIFKANYEIPADVIKEIKKCSKKIIEPSEKRLTKAIIDNAAIAKKRKLALCQDTGISCFFVEIGKVHLNSSINSLLNKAVKKTYASGKLRPSIVDDPLNGHNTGDNTPASIHIEHNNTPTLKISYLAKGGGSENASGLAMLNPSDGFDGVKDFVIKLIKEKGANCCPPLIVGVAIGGPADKALLYSKKALLRKVGEKNKDPFYAKKEEELKKEINKLNIGVMGLGGVCTALDVFIEPLPRHIATLAVGVSVICHSNRRGSISI